MACDTVDHMGVAVLVCGRRRRKACSVCKRPSSRLCDFKLAVGGTCDKELCSSCAVHLGTNVDHCPGHPREQLSLVAP